ncbi:hypothetical protein GGR58DRAFT_523602 [Xylaria digitata]|nr:hypothetical protein GGR58DRAFT_523602 [Xylaria digitata]
MAFEKKEFSRLSFDGSSIISDNDNESMVALLGERGLSSPSRCHRAALVLRITLVFITYIEYFMEPTDFSDCSLSDTVGEVRAKGCVFDPMGWAWVCPECFNCEIVEEYLGRGNFTFHTDLNLTSESIVPMDIIFQGDCPKLFTQKLYHLVNCTKRMHKAVVEGLSVDSYSISSHHTRSCEQALLRNVLHEDIECAPDMVCPTVVRATWTS